MHRHAGTRILLVAATLLLAAGAAGPQIAWRRGHQGALLPPEQLRRAVADLKQTLPVSIYMQGYLVDPRTDVVRKHGGAWTILNKDGRRLLRPALKDAKDYTLCAGAAGWQDYLAAAYGRVVEEIAPSNGVAAMKNGFFTWAVNRPDYSR